MQIFARERDKTYPHPHRTSKVCHSFKRMRTNGFAFASSSPTTASQKIGLTTQTRMQLSQHIHKTTTTTTTPTTLQQNHPHSFSMQLHQIAALISVLRLCTTNAVPTPLEDLELVLMHTVGNTSYNKLAFKDWEPFQGYVYFTMHDATPPDRGGELWRANETHVELAVDTYPGNDIGGSLWPRHLTDLNDEVLFFQAAGSSYERLWAFNGQELIEVTPWTDQETSTDYQLESKFAPFPDHGFVLFASGHHIYKSDGKTWELVHTFQVGTPRPSVGSFQPVYSKQLAWPTFTQVPFWRKTCGRWIQTRYNSNFGKTCHRFSPTRSPSSTTI